MLQFKVVCFKRDVGIFTCYGAKVSHAPLTPVDPCHVHHNEHGHNHNHGYGPQHEHLTPAPGYRDKIMYNVLLYINPELNQSEIIYSTDNINIARLVLNNFINLAIGGESIINVDKISDKHPMEFVHKHHCQFKDDECDPLHNPWDKCWKDEHKVNPYYAVYNESKCIPEAANAKDLATVPHCYGPMIDVDECHRPLPDGCEMHFHRHDVERAITTVIPNTLERILYEVTPPERRPDYRHSVKYFYGDAGIAFGGSVVNNLSEMNEFALHTMLRRNGRPTYIDGNDRINIKPMISRTIVESNVFTIDSKDNDSEWAFFMIPDYNASLIANFTFYCQENGISDPWTEITDTNLIQRRYVLQDNGIRYYVVAMRFGSKFAIKFAKSGLSNEEILNGKLPSNMDDGSSDNTGGSADWTAKVLFKVNGSTLPADTSFSYKPVSGGTDINIYFVNNTLTAELENLEDGKEYVINKKVGELVTPMVYFTAYQKPDGTTELLTKDTAESAYVARRHNTISINL